MERQGEGNINIKVDQSYSQAMLRDRLPPADVISRLDEESVMNIRQVNMCWTYTSLQRLNIVWFTIH